MSLIPCLLDSLNLFIEGMVVFWVVQIFMWVKEFGLVYLVL